MNFCVNCGSKRATENLAPVGRLMSVEKFLCDACETSHNFKPLFVCVLTDKIVPKCRPRVTKRVTFMPPHYTLWRTLATAEINAALYYHNTTQQPIELPFDRISPVAITADFYGSLRANADIDNAIGSIMDVLAADKWALTNDNVSRVPIVSIQFHSLPKNTKKNPQTPKTIVKIYAL